MKPGIIAASAAIALIAATSAIAQTAGPTNRMPSNPTRMTNQQQASRFEAEEMRRRNMTPQEAEAEYGAERMDLARRVQAMIDEGRCAEARAAANEAGERQMALRVRQTCRAR